MVKEMVFFKGNKFIGDVIFDPAKVTAIVSSDAVTKVYIGNNIIQLPDNICISEVVKKINSCTSPVYITYKMK